KAKEAAQLKADGEALLNKAVADKKITAAAKPAWLKMYENDPESAKAAIEAMAPVAKITTTPTGTGGGNSEDRSEWDYDTYATKDPKALVAMAQSSHENHEDFKRIYKDRYGKDYKG